MVRPLATAGAEGESALTPALSHGERGNGFLLAREWRIGVIFIATPGPGLGPAGEQRFRLRWRER